MTTANQNPFYVPPSQPAPVDTITQSSVVKEGGIDWGRMIIDSNSINSYWDGWKRLAEGGVNLYKTIKDLQAKKAQDDLKKATKAYQSYMDALLQQTKAGGAPEHWDKVRASALQGIGIIGFNTEWSARTLWDLQQMGDQQ